MQSAMCPFCMTESQDSNICPHCGGDIHYPGHLNHLPVGYALQGLHTYVFGIAIGQGGFGITYIALDMDTNTRVAIKEYFPTHCCGRINTTTVCSNPGQENTFVKGKQHFILEAQMLQSLSDLGSVVKVLDYLECNNTAYLVMEYLDGSSLKDHVEQNGRLPAQEFLVRMKPLMADMEKMHRRGVVHRDIAPDNIIQLKDGRLKLIDFGAARSYVGDKSMTVVVKKGFAPVEQYMRKGSNASTDVYALAATIYYCITGIVPPDSAERQYGDASLQAPTSLGVELSEDQELGLEKALDIQPNTRTQNVAELANALDHLPESILQKQKITHLRKETPRKKREEDHRQREQHHDNQSKLPEKREKTSSGKSGKWLAVIAAAFTVVIAGVFLLSQFVPQAEIELSVQETTPSEVTTSAAIVPAETTPKSILPPVPETQPTIVETEPAVDTYYIAANKLTPSMETSKIPELFFWGQKKWRRKDINTITFVGTLDSAPPDAVDVSAAQDRSVLAWMESKGNLIVGANGNISPNPSPEYTYDAMFSSFTNLERIDFGTCFDAQHAKNMSYMFHNCKSLTKLDLSGFNTSYVISMAGIFSGCESLKELDLSSLDTSNVTDMSYMFSECKSLTDLNVSGLDTSNVTNMENMFYACESLTELDLSSLNTSSAREMCGMFSSCTALIKLNLSNFDTSNVYTIDGMFGDCKSLTELDLSSFNTSGVISMAAVFSGCESLKELDLSNFNTSRVDYMGFMFKNCESLTHLDLSSFDTSNVEYMWSMFSNCKSLTTLDLSNFNTSKAKRMSHMFSDCSSLFSLDLKNFNTSSVDEMYGMFYNCTSLYYSDLSSFEISDTTDTEDMFKNCPIERPTWYKPVMD